MLATLLLLLCAGNCVWLSAASSYNSCQSPPGLPGRDGRDGRDGAPGPAGPPGSPGRCEVSVHIPTLLFRNQTNLWWPCTDWDPGCFYSVSAIVIQVVIQVMVEDATVQFCTRGCWHHDPCKLLALYQTWPLSPMEKYILLQANCIAVFSDLL